MLDCVDQDAVVAVLQNGSGARLTFFICTRASVTSLSMRVVNVVHDRCAGAQQARNDWIITT